MNTYYLKNFHYPSFRDALFSKTLTRDFTYISHNYSSHSTFPFLNEGMKDNEWRRRSGQKRSGNKGQKKLEAPLEKWRRTNRAAFLVVKSTRGRLSDANCHLLFHANATWVARYTQGIDTRVNEERRAGLAAIALANYS